MRDGRTKRKFAAWLVCMLLFLCAGSAYADAAMLEVLQTAEDGQSGQPGAEGVSNELIALQVSGDESNSDQSDRPSQSGAEPGTEAKFDQEAEAVPGAESGSEAENGMGAEFGTGTEPGTEKESGAGAETGIGVESGSGAEPGTEKESGSESESDVEVGSGMEAESNTEAESGTKAESNAEAESNTEAESGTKADSNTEAESGMETESGAEAGSDTEAQSDTEVESETESEPTAVMTAEEGWQDCMVRQAGGVALFRAASPVIHREDSTILSYLDFPCYFKYATGHGMDTGGKKVAVYCVYNTREAPENEPYEPKDAGAFSKEITYCLYNGCRYRGSTSYNPAYSTGDWKKDYYLTQIAIHVINYRQGRESSIESDLKKSSNEKVYNLAYQMIADAYADTAMISSANNQSMEVTCAVSPVSQDAWVRQADGSWRTQADYTCSSNLPERVSASQITLAEGLPSGIGVGRQDAGDALSPFWFTATEEAHRAISREHLTVSAVFQASCEEYGGWWYVPVDSSVKRQYVTFLSQQETPIESAVSFQVTATSPVVFFDVALKKKDQTDQQGIAGAVYGLYTDEACTALAAQFPATDANGDAQLTGLQMAQEVYYVKELQAPAGYCRDQQVYPVRPGETQQVRLELTDVPRKTAVRVYKEGELLTGAVAGEHGITFVYEKRGLAGAVFDLYAADTIADARGRAVLSKNALAAADLVTGEDGYAQSGPLWPGNYYLVEKSAPDNMVTHGTPVPVTLAAENEMEELTVHPVTVRNQRQKLSLTVQKTDGETAQGVAGGSFGLFAGADIYSCTGQRLAAADALLDTAVSDAQGNARFQTELPGGYPYYVRELQAPAGYVLEPDWEYRFEMESRPQAAELTLQTECVNQRYRGTLALQKLDGETNTDSPQGDATLEGAQYGLYAREAIVHPDGHTGVLYEKDEQVALLTTDAQGRADVTELYLGRYYLKELLAPTGYVKDEAEYEITFSAEMAGRKTDPGTDTDLTADPTIIMRKAVVTEQVKKQPFQLLKVSNAGETNPKPLAGAGFSAWLISDLAQDEEGGYVTEGAAPVALGASGETELFTDENGYLCTVPLPYGRYLVRETTVPAEHRPVRDFIVTVSEHLPDQPQPWRVFLDDLFMARLKIVKKDQESGAPILIPGAEFRIWDCSAENYVEQAVSYPESKLQSSFYTNEEGYLILPQELEPGEYRIEEVTAPDGYLKCESPVPFVVASDMAYLVDPVTGDPLLECEVYDEPIRGRIRVEKTGERPEDFAEDFQYHPEPLAKVRFDVVAEEDILSPDGQREADGTRRVLYPKGTLVTTLVTGEDGCASTEPLPLGTYRVLEKEAPSGYLADQEGRLVVLTQQGQDEPLVTETVKLENIRQRLQIRVKKVDNESKKPLGGAKLVLYAKDDIRTQSGEVIVKADTALDTCITDEAGEGSFSRDLPHGRYYVVEEEAPRGYVREHGSFEIDLRAGKVREHGSFENDLRTGKVREHSSFENDLRVGKVRKNSSFENDLRAGKVRENSSFQNDLRATKAGTQAAEKETEEERSYECAYQYDEQGNCTVTLTVANTQTVVEVSKTDMVDGAEIPGARLTLLDEAGEVVDTWISEEEPHRIRGLEPGASYTLREETAPFGYVIAEEVSFAVENTGEIQKVTMQDRHAMGRLKLKKKEKGSKKALAGAVFELRTESGEVLEELVTDRKGEAESSLLEIGTFTGGRLEKEQSYVLVETKAPKGYKKDETEYQIAFQYQGAETAVIEVTKQIENEKKPVPATAQSPRTGDSAPVGSWLALLLLSGGVLLIGAMTGSHRGRRAESRRRLEKEV